jgi:RND family efflux transporter MFP subunit
MTNFDHLVIFVLITIYMKNKFIQILSISLILSFLLSGCGESPETEQKIAYVPNVKTVIVEPGFHRELVITGEVKASKSAMLTAPMRANVYSAPVQVGDYVIQGQLLLQLSDNGVSTNLNIALTALNNALASLEQIKISSQNNIDTAELAYQNASETYENTINQNEVTLAQAEENLNTAAINLDLQIQSAETALNNATGSTLPAVQSAITTVDAIVGVSSVYANANNAYEVNLGALDSSTKRAAEAAIEDTLDKLEVYEESYDNALDLVTSCRDAVANTLEMLKKSISSATYPQAKLTADINSVAGQLSAMQNVIASLESAKNALDTVSKTVGDTSQTLINAQAAYDSIVAQLTTAANNAKNMTETAFIALSNTKTGAEISILNAESNIDSIRGNYNQAQINQQKLSVTAPFSGQITQIEVEAGDEVNAGTKLVGIENSDTLKIVASLAADEIGKINVGDEVKIGKESSDVIATIAPSADPMTKKYKIEIFHDNQYLRPGQFIKLKFQIGEIDSRIFIPITGINILADSNFVWAIKDGKAVKTFVELGEIEGEFVEIKEGVIKGDEVVIEGGRILEVKDDIVDVEITEKLEL